MTWTDPVRYPNSAEIADNEAFLNTNVIDNLIDHESRINSVGMVLIASGTVSNAYQTFTSVFSATYDNYFVTFRGICPQSTSNIDCQLLSGATAASTNYVNQRLTATSTSVTANGLDTNSVDIGVITQSISGVSAYIYGPFLASQTAFTGHSTIPGRLDLSGGTHSTASSYDGIKFMSDVDQPGRFLTGTFKLYGLT